MIPEERTAEVWLVPRKRNEVLDSDWCRVSGRMIRPTGTAARTSRNLCLLGHCDFRENVGIRLDGARFEGSLVNRLDLVNGRAGVRNGHAMIDGMIRARTLELLPRIGRGVVQVRGLAVGRLEHR